MNRALTPVARAARATLTKLVLISLLGLAGCGSRAANPKTSTVKAVKAGPPTAATSAQALEELPPSYPTPPPGKAPGIPVSIRRIVAEQKDELRDMSLLASVVGDARGRVRAQAEVATLTNEFSAIELHLDSAESERLDDTMQKLQTLETKIGILHDALRQANVQGGEAKAVD